MFSFFSEWIKVPLKLFECIWHETFWMRTSLNEKCTGSFHKNDAFISHNILGCDCQMIMKKDHSFLLLTKFSLSKTVSTENSLVFASIYTLFSVEISIVMYTNINLGYFFIFRFNCCIQFANKRFESFRQRQSRTINSIFWMISYYIYV